MEERDLDTLRFFEDHPEALPLFLELEGQLYARFPETGKRVRKTQIAFTRRFIYACVSFARVKRKAELPDPFLVLTLGLPEPLDSRRVAVRVEPYPGRWTHHIVLSRPEDLDEELFSWVREAYAFAGGKRNARGRTERIEKEVGP